MDTNGIIAALKSRRSSLDTAIAALEGKHVQNGRRPTTSSATGRGGRRRMSVAGRRRLSMLLKKRWAAGKMGKRRKAV